jgi:hypothetical protein
MSDQPVLPTSLIAYVIEKLALRLAEQRQGWITANDLMPYLPLSLGVIRDHLEQIAASAEMWVAPHNRVLAYTFPAYQDAPPRPGVLQLATCLVCDMALPAPADTVLCAPCIAVLLQELQALPDASVWRARAAIEHEILYNAAQHQGPVSATVLASRSRLQLQHLRPHLERLGLDGFVQQEVDDETGLLTYEFPPLHYPTSLYQRNQRTLHPVVEPRPPQRAWYTVGLALAVMLLGAGLWLTHGVRSRPDTPPVPPRSLPPVTAPSPTAASVTRVRVSIMRDGFRPVSMSLAASQHPPLLLTDQRPPGLVKEPRYQGPQQKYAVLRLGQGAHPTYTLALDLLPHISPVLYVDLNQNGDLTDDGPPLTNQGTGFFATRLRVPFASLVPSVTVPGYYEAWLFTNTGLWQNSLITYYSRTQFKGTVRLAGHTYTAYLAEGQHNDADFTNDGIHIDLNGDGKISAETESFPPGTLLHLGGRAYAFEITW